MSDQSGEIPGMPNSEWFAVMAHTKKDMAAEAADPVEQMNLRQEVADAGWRSVVENTRESIQQFHPDVELPAVMDGEGVADYTARAFAFLNEHKGKDTTIEDKEE